MFNSEKDYLGAWFDVRRALGVDDTILIGRVDISQNAVEWHEYRHADYDGVGALAHFLQHIGYGRQVLPKSKFSAPQTLAEKTQLTLNPAGRHKPASVRWKSITHFQHNPNQPPKTADIAWRVLSPEQSKSIDVAAKNAGVSVNSFFHWALHQASLLLMDGVEEVSWFYPVNLRGAFSKQDTYANHSAGLYCNLPADATPQQVHLLLSEQLKRKSHWGLVYQAQFGALLGKRFMSRVLKANLKNGRYAGSLSVLGNWPNTLNESDQREKLAREAILICAPGSPSYPISTGIIRWGDRYTLCLKLNPVLQNNAYSADAVLEQWQSRLLPLS